MAEARAMPKLFTAGRRSISLIEEATTKHSQGVTPAALAGLSSHTSVSPASVRARSAGDGAGGARGGDDAQDALAV
eukprot:1891231-Prymnesium_polylepis.2